LNSPNLATATKYGEAHGGQVRPREGLDRHRFNLGLGETRLRRKRILGDVVEGGEDLGSEESERQGPEPQPGRVELSVGQPGDAAGVMT
jgi:hypothetical protein